MKGYKIATILVMGLLVMGVPAMAQGTALKAAEQLEVGAGITPDSPLHGLDKAVEQLQLLLTLDHEKKAELHYNFAQERLAEAKTMTERDMPELAQKGIEEYEDELNETNEEIEQAVAVGRNVTALSQHVEEMTSKHVVVLRIIYEKAPETAKPAIQKTIDDSLERQAEIVLRIEGTQLVETTIMVDGEEVTIRVSERAKEELEEYDALEEMTEVREDLEELLAEAEEAGVTVPEDSVAEINNLLDQAQAAFDAENFEQAEELADQADELLDSLEDEMEGLIEEPEDEEAETEEGTESEGPEESETGETEEGAEIEPQ